MGRTYRTHGELRYAYETLIEETESKRSVSKHTWRETLKFNLNLLKPTGYVMQQHFNIQQLYALPTLYLCVLYLSENKQRLVPLTA